ncbi:hypothetical protein GTA08_BOTSDO12076 [Botryosphaeria dothidea]|uniref:Uncharacterized protein n=1 Tax=Botryosphaeria dothidea TaxID=55169 RepID=A0A8H4J3N6_9PEZI|nr:hypothetical protein GTA08_BOTSDO12076 [Botryosphaeria dothidea]
MRSLYGAPQTTEADCIQEVQKILRSLYDIANNMPSEISVDFASPRLTVSRIAASLYLWLFQAIILCVRPVVLHMVQCRVQERQETLGSQPFAPILVRLSRTCLEAAAKSLQILSALKDQGLLAVFGYFDLDATFSVAFVLIMTSIIHTDGTPSQHHGIRDAILLLEYMAHHGNEAAEIRKRDIEQMCRVVWPCHHDDRGPTIEATCSFTPLQSGGETLVRFRGQGETYPSTRQHVTIPPSSPAPFREMDRLNHLIFEAFEDLDNAEGGGILSMYNDPTLPLTGVDASDWEEMESILLR